MNKWIRIIVLDSLLLMVLSNVYAQPIRLQFKHLTPNDGLSSSTVTCFLQDYKGFMWIGTYYGLNRYDGYTFDIYSHHSAASNSLPHDLIWTMYEDHQNKLYIGTSVGLSSYNREKNIFINYMQDTNSPLSAFKSNVVGIAEDSLANLWLATNQGLIYFERKLNRAHRYRFDPNNSYSLSNNNVESVFIDSKNNIWVSTRKGLNLFQPETGRFLHITSSLQENNDLSDAYFTKGIEDKKGTLWFGTYNSGLFRLALHGTNLITVNNYRHNPKESHSLSADRILSLFVDKQGELWVGTENGGLNLLNKKTRSFWHYRSDELDLNSLNNESIFSIYEDHTGDLWIGTFNGGINLSRKNSDALYTYKKLPGVPTSLSCNSVTCFMEDHHGKIWVGTDGGGINLFDLQNNHFTQYNSRNTNLKSDAVISMSEDSDQQLWLGTWEGGLNRFDERTKTFHSFTTKNSSIPDDNINSIVVDTHGDLWIGSYQSGLIHYQKKNNKFINYTTQNSDISLNIISVLGLAPDGTILVGTGSGLNVFNPQNKQFTKYLHSSSDAQSISSNGIQSLAIENDTSIWIGTNDGLNLFNPKTKLFTRFSAENGLPDNVIKGLVFDTSGGLWVTTNKGLCRFTIQYGVRKIFTKDDGLQSNEFNNGSVLRLSDHGLLFGGTNGFNLMYPEKISENKNIPPVLITGLLIFNKPVGIGIQGSPLTTQISETDRLNLSYEQSVFTFSFAALDFTVPGKNQYAYYMEGFEKNWNYVGTKRSANYTNLDAGKYIFRVKASNNDDVWNEAGTSLTLIITPPFWKTLWFRLLGIFILLGSAFVFYKSRTTRIHANNLLLQQRVAERTAQLEAANKELESFAYSVSHDLRAPLRAIDGFAHILMEDYMQSLDEAGRHACDVISNETKRMGQLIEDFLSLSHSSYAEIHISLINMEAMVHSVFDDLMRTENPERIDYHIGALPSTYGDPVLFREVWVNLISNALKYSSKRIHTKIDVNYRQEGQRIIYFIRDNGVGFDMKYAHKLFGVFQRLHSDKEFEGTGVGLAIVKRLIQRHGGEVWAESEIDQGSTFNFTVSNRGGER